MKFKRLLITLLTVATVYFGSNLFLNRLENKKNITNYGKEAASENKYQKVDHEILVLMVGVDVNENNENPDFTRTDTIMLCKINAETGKVDLLSIPRDSRIKVRDEFTKANHAHAYGGIGLTLKSLRDFLGLDIDYYVEINYDALVNIVDGMGGLKYKVPKGISIDHGDVHIRPGINDMDGMDVLWYLRTRKIYNNGDLGRVNAQQEFLKTIVNELVKKSKEISMTSLIETYFKDVKTNLPFSTMVEFANSMSNFSSDKFKTYTVPGEASMIDGISYYIPDYEATWDIVNKVFPKYKLKGWKKEDSYYWEYEYYNYSYKNYGSNEDYNKIKENKDNNLNNYKDFDDNKDERKEKTDDYEDNSLDNKNYLNDEIEDFTEDNY
ncbi:cell envelope-like function transcriptional attenuator common domain protein [Anaerococcus hydrogenalis DSM 7454]|uniref:Cell envelope-like function transcriptional attenuator common domain protein n=1 Tax=Anaerococcus hydrogenalis DSM 7454 TaxID=561177 RepID=B6W7I2_9FIRM|nr:LCP family protein [Anaerococcus hydrogenalis]EEB36589.1 cell envelope-like function transcriptional attenuator common domain protein [Anaerococcus hydrogenalis DSM 7454]